MRIPSKSRTLHHQPQRQLGTDLLVSAVLCWTFPALCSQGNPPINPHNSGGGYEKVTCHKTNVLIQNVEIDG